MMSLISQLADKQISKLLDWLNPLSDDVSIFTGQLANLLIGLLATAKITNQHLAG